MASAAVTVLVRATPVTPVSPAIVSALVEKALEKNWTPAYGALGIRGVLAAPELRLTDSGGRDVRVAFAGSALAARELLASRTADDWLVLVTDRDEQDLGAGVLAHLIGQELRSPDPWQAVRQRFRAATVDASLTAVPRSREIAYGLLEAMPLDAWSPAPAGGLTRDHAYGSLARAVLDLPAGAVDLITVLGWSTRAGFSTRWAGLRDRGGDAVADGAGQWVAAGCGIAAAAVGALLAQGRLSDLAPLGLVVHLLTGGDVAPADTRLGLASLAHLWGGSEAPDVETALLAVAAQTPVVLATLLADERTRPDAERVLAAADLLARQAGAQRLTERSELLPSGLAARFLRLAALLQDRPVEQVADLNRAYADLVGHLLLTAGDVRRPAVTGAARLVRWLASPEQPPSGGSRLGSLAVRQVAVDGWVDAAVNDVATGVDDLDLGEGLGHVLALVRDRRDGHDREFAAALAASTTAEEGVDAGYLEADGTRIWLLERLLPDLLLPLVKGNGGSAGPTLLLVLDGLSTGVASELVEDVLASGDWSELLPDGAQQRAGALAVLPTITEVSRASLLCGALTSGQQDVERRGYAALARAKGVGAALFHKRSLDTTRAGFALADEVRAALDDTTGTPLVACVLNTIDDALDRSDPGGTVWDVAHVKHLRPLLERARETSRTVVITADHGHVVDRRVGRQRAQPDGERKTRYRQVTDADVAADEVLVSGPRVLEGGGRLVLAVDERLRYGPLKAGYHGGAAPAEAVVPVVLLVPSERARADASGLRLALPQAPSWWAHPAPQPQTDPASGADQAELRPSSQLMPTLFDEPPEALPVRAAGSLGALITGSATYADQRGVAGRLAVADEQVAQVVDALLASGHRLRPEQLASLLRLPVVRVRGATEQLVRVLNVDGYPVLSRDPATGAVVLDEALAREQFGLPR